jgi:hypothetical protein
MERAEAMNPCMVILELNILQMIEVFKMRIRLYVIVVYFL